MGKVIRACDTPPTSVYRTIEEEVKFDQTPYPDGVATYVVNPDSDIVLMSVEYTEGSPGSPVTAFKVSATNPAGSGVTHEEIYTGDGVSVLPGQMLIDGVEVLVESGGGELSVSVTNDDLQQAGQGYYVTLTLKYLIEQP